MFMDENKKERNQKHESKDFLSHLFFSFVYSTQMVYMTVVNDFNAKLARDDEDTTKPGESYRDIPS